MLRFLIACPTRAVRHGRLAATLGVALLIAPTGLAQQFVVDDAGITDEGACQFEGWIGETSGWIIPACTPISRTEIALGIGYGDDDLLEPGDDEFLSTLEMKVNLLPDDPGTVGLAFVANVQVRPFADGRLSAEEVSIYLPITYTFNPSGTALHLNGGWIYEFAGDEHLPLYGARADIVLHDYVTATGEIYGEGPDALVQAGLRFSILPDLLLADVSYGTTVRGDTPDIGFTFGIAITPRPFFRPVRF